MITIQISFKDDEEIGRKFVSISRNKGLKPSQLLKMLAFEVVQTQQP